MLQTHASAVLLTPTRVYKIKKPKNFGFFDYSTPALRRHFCQQEVLLNRGLAPQIYLGVAPVLAFADGQVRFGATYAPDAVPLPGAVLEEGHVVDYAVVMVRLADEATLESRVRAGTATPALLAEVAQVVASFHATASTDEHISSFGNLDGIRGNWTENFEQMKPFLGRTINAAIYDLLVGYVHRVLQDRAALFASRVQEGRVRDCHGDLRLQHVYILDAKDDSPSNIPHLALLDRIEFNERFRYGDVASEVAFLAMELDAASRPDLARAFVTAYIDASGDEAVRELLPFYCCYRACVRGKVFSFQLDEPEVPAVQQTAARQTAASLFSLAVHYASCPTQPTLLMIGGLMGTGKSTLALALQHEGGWNAFSSDTLRKQLAHVDSAHPLAEAFSQGVYSPDWTARTYHALRAKTRETLARGRSVLLDASFLRREYRHMMVQEARAGGATVLFVECLCPQVVVLKRLAERWDERVEGRLEKDEKASRASDGRPDLYDAQRTQWENVTSEEEEQGMRHIVVETALPLVINVEQVLDALHIPRFACWL